MAKFGVNEHGRWDESLAKAQFHNTVQNIRDVHAKASKFDIETGSTWYPRMRDVAEKLGKGNLEMGAGLIASLSPALGLKENLDAAHHVMQKGTASKWQTEDNNTKALRIRAGEHPLDVLGGHKVRSFYHNISNPESPEHVTIDRHAYNLAIGIPFGKKSTEKQDLGLGAIGRYQHFVHGYKHAAEQLEYLQPHQLQAITWGVHRGSFE